MIKKELKKFYFIDEEDVINLGIIFVSPFVSPGVYTIEHDITILRTGDVNNLEVTGDIRVNNGRLHSVGTVIWNQELQRLEYWDGAMWQHLVTNNIV